MLNCCTQSSIISDTAHKRKKIAHPENNINNCSFLLEDTTYSFTKTRLQQGC